VTCLERLRSFFCRPKKVRIKRNVKVMVSPHMLFMFNDEEPCYYSVALPDLENLSIFRSVERSMGITDIIIDNGGKKTHYWVVGIVLRRDDQ
jgi:hypothetical protein